MVAPDLAHFDPDVFLDHSAATLLLSCCVIASIVMPGLASIVRGTVAGVT
jgi:hypothetical protein